MSCPGQSGSSTPRYCGVVHVDGTVCRTESSCRPESRGASGCPAPAGLRLSAAVGWIVPGQVPDMACGSRPDSRRDCAAAIRAAGPLVAPLAGARVVVPDRARGGPMTQVNATSELMTQIHDARLRLDGQDSHNHCGRESTD